MRDLHLRHIDIQLLDGHWLVVIRVEWGSSMVIEEKEICHSWEDVKRLIVDSLQITEED